MTDHDDSQLPLTETEKHVLLADELRRRLLRVLATVELPIKLHDLASELLERTNDSDAPAFEGVKLRLHHHHLPMLTEYDVIRYDSRDKLVVEAIVDLDQFS